MRRAYGHHSVALVTIEPTTKESEAGQQPAQVSGKGELDLEIRSAARGKMDDPRKGPDHFTASEVCQQGADAKVDIHTAGRGRCCWCSLQQQLPLIETWL